MTRAHDRIDLRLDRLQSFDLALGRGDLVLREQPAKLGEQPVQAVQWHRQRRCNLNTDRLPIRGVVEDEQAALLRLAVANAQARSDALLRAIPDLMFVLRRDGTYLDYHARDPHLLFAPPDAFENGSSLAYYGSENEWSRRQFEASKVAEQPNRLGQRLVHHGQPRALGLRGAHDLPAPEQLLLGAEQRVVQAPLARQDVHEAQIDPVHGHGARHGLELAQTPHFPEPPAGVPLLHQDLERQPPRRAPVAAPLLRHPAEVDRLLFDPTLIPGRSGVLAGRRRRNGRASQP